MPDINNFKPEELPHATKLIRSTILALFIAAGLLVTVVLPAEYGVDPTGTGRVLGLTEMGQIKVSLAKEAALSSAPDVAASLTRLSVEQPAIAPTRPVPVHVPEDVPPVETPAPPPATNSHETKVSLKPGEGKEIKLVMREGAKVRYSWSTDRGVVNYDLHADSVNPPRDYHGYKKGKEVASDAGELIAAFEGNHGWFWRNRMEHDVTVTLKTEGEYSELKEHK
ncbi:MAG: transmembrane anchor protein [Thermoanaerobaculia bacterium]|jgi:hypothetical protein